MQTFSDYLRGCATVMHNDRTDIWPTLDDAYSALLDWFSELQDDNYFPHGSIGSGGYELRRDYRVDEEGVEEYELVRKVLSYNIYPEEHETNVFDWTTHSNAFPTDLGFPEPDIFDDLEFNDPED